MDEWQYFDQNQFIDKFYIFCLEASTSVHRYSHSFIYYIFFCVRTETFQLIYNISVCFFSLDCCFWIVDFHLNENSGFATV